MAERADPWARWVLRPGNELESMQPTRDRVLANAGLSPGDVLLDVGCGSGLIAFGAVPIVGDEGRVIFTDVSETLLAHCRREAAERGVAERCRFLVASADNIVGVDDEAVDAVTTRSVLIYVKDKERAFRELFRVLRPGGRVSIFEPINSFDYPWPPERFLGYDVTPVADLVRKVMSVYDRLQSQEDPMLDFDERDLLRHAEAAGFVDIHLTLEATIGSRPWARGPWEAFLRTTGNPCVPPLEEVLDEALAEAEKERFRAHLQPLVERGEGESRLALAYLWALKL
ncbi:MAG: class I SAM-dependent methyltransferase [Gaiellaceae bacterium]